eukprot:TRINITY_DN3849_c0_g1_i2.p1 TRINITY_DN3849_c0_g1~~TRINITY_DN3849_c0_g1_i2.p1  ORF type:complete len:422 (+),score=37.23 TRINITY_DN3849_c0_g1_i2:111-1268(+)
MNQMTELPWERPSSTVVPSPKVTDNKTKLQTYKQYNTRYNLWSNPYLVSRKTAKFYHLPNQVFASTHASDDEIQHLTNLEDNSMKMKRNMMHKMSQKKLQKTRQLEREVLQKESSQKDFHKTYFKDETALNPDTLKEIKLKKSMSFINPSKTEKLCPSCLYQYQNLPERQLRILLRPSILKADDRNLPVLTTILVACKRIAKKIEDEENAIELLKAWRDKNRASLREKLHDRHSSTSHLGQRLGITTFDSFNSTTNKFANISRLAQPPTPKLKNTYLKSEFRGLILPNYSLARAKKFALDKEGLKQSFTSKGFPFPEHSGILHKASNQPLSRTVNLDNCEMLTVCKEKTEKKAVEKKKQQEWIEAENDIKVIHRKENYKNRIGRQ